MEKNNLNDLNNQQQFSQEEYEKFLQFKKFQEQQQRNSMPINNNMGMNNSNQYQQYNNQGQYVKPTKTKGIVIAVVIAVIMGLLCLCGLGGILTSSTPKTMPDVSGASTYDAERQLKNALGDKISIERINEYNDNIEKGHVIGTEPQAGSEFTTGTIVKLHISDGKEKIMPDIVGMNINKATELLSEMGFDIHTTEEYNDAEAGTIIQSEYEAGTDMNDKYGYIDVTVSKGSIQDLKDNAQEVSYEELYRYPETYKDTPLRMNVTITKIDDSKFLGVSYSTAYWATYNGETIILYDNRVTKEPAVKVNDKLTIYGLGNGASTIDVKEKEYQGSLLLGFSYDKTVDSYDVPCINIEYLELR